MADPWETLCSYLHVLVGAVGGGRSAEDPWRGCRAENRELEYGSSSLLSSSHPGLPNQAASD